MSLVFRVRPCEDKWEVVVGRLHERVVPDPISDADFALVAATEAARAEVARGTPAVTVLLTDADGTEHAVSRIGCR